MVTLKDTLNRHMQSMLEREIFDKLFRHPVSHLWNRESFVYKQQVTPASLVAMVDMDSLKYFNDTQGHIIGDLMIEQLGRYLSTNIDCDSVFHLSGDEFVVTWDGGRESFESTMSVLCSDTQIPFSYGIAEDLGAADVAMRLHKSNREKRGERVARGCMPNGFDNSIFDV